MKGKSKYGQRYTYLKRCKCSISGKLCSKMKSYISKNGNSRLITCRTYAIVSYGAREATKFVYYN